MTGDVAPLNPRLIATIPSGIVTADHQMAMSQEPNKNANGRLKAAGRWQARDSPNMFYPSRGSSRGRLSGSGELC